MAEALKINADQSDCILDMMIHTGSAREQCWFRPCIKVSGEEVSILWPAVDGVNYSRLTDWLFAQVHEFEQELGERFESFVHESIGRCFQQSPLRQILKLSKSPGVDVKIGRAVEEIDLAFLVGRKLFVCELKSTQYPTDPLEHLTYRNRLSEAAMQALRKVAFISSDIASSMKQLGIQCDNESNIEIHPLIIMSGSLLAGWSWKGVGVSDLPIVLRFFLEGRLDVAGFYDESGSFSAAITQPFYRSIDEAESCVADYFGHAPQVKLFEEFVESSVGYLPDLDGSNKRKLVRSFRVQPPHEGFKRMIKEKQQALKS